MSVSHNPELAMVQGSPTPSQAAPCKGDVPGTGCNGIFPRKTDPGLCPRCLELATYFMDHPALREEFEVSFSHGDYY